MISSPVRISAGRLFLAIGVLGLLLAIVGLLLPVVWNAASGEDKDRKAVAAAATDFSAAFATFDTADIADYQKRIKGSMTEDFFKKTKDLTDAAFPVMAKSDIKNSGAVVRAVGVSGLDKDSAVAVVAVDSNATKKGVKASLEQNFRWTLTLVKVDGKWLVDSYSQLPQSFTQPADEGSDK